MKKLFVLMAAVALVWAVAVPASAVDWNFYGSARMATYWVSEDYRNVASPDKENFLQWDFQGNSRIGARVKHEGGLAGHFELGLKGDSAGDLDPGTRRLYGTWDFGAGILKVGKDYTPISQFTSGQVFGTDQGLLGMGTMYGKRIGQVSLTFGGFEIAFITPSQNQIETEDGESTDGNVERYFPKFEGKFGMAMDAFDFNIRGGYQYYKIKDTPTLDDPARTKNVDVTSYVLGADVGLNFGPMYFKGTGSFGENWDAAEWNPGFTGVGTKSDERSVVSPAFWDGSGGTDDTKSWMASLVGGFKMTDMLTFEAGAGYRVDDPDQGEKSKIWSYYIQAVIGLAPGVWLVPEVGYTDFDEKFNGDAQGREFYAGAKWQIDF